jgi:ribosomal protein L14E/L6E/L27E
LDVSLPEEERAAEVTPEATEAPLEAEKVATEAPEAPEVSEGAGAVTEAAGEEEAAGAAAPLREAGAAEAEEVPAAAEEEAPEPPTEAGREVDTKQPVGSAAGGPEGEGERLEEQQRYLNLPIPQTPELRRVRREVKSKNKVINAPKLRTSITPGTVLILLAGHFKGKRVVFLKQLEYGLLLVTGPFKVNGVPLRRVNQAYVIATSTKIDISSVDVAKHGDAYFKRAVTKSKKGESEFFEAEKEKEEKSLPKEKKEDQKAIDAKRIPLIEAVPEMKTYLSARFSLKSGVKPHELVF